MSSDRLVEGWCVGRGPELSELLPHDPREPCSAPPKTSIVQLRLGFW